MATRYTVYSFPMMVTNTQLLQAKSLANHRYTVTKNETSARVKPPEGQSINKRILKKLIAEAGDDWKTYYGASLTFIIQGTHAEEERERILNLLDLEYARCLTRCVRLASRRSVTRRV